MREFTIRGADFFLNGERAFLRGGNIAFHRFLSDPERGLLPWTPEWVKRALIDIPKKHNFNFFRVHLGQMYNLWYDIADRHGMLLQNEWQSWGVTGTKEQIRREFTQWLRDNWNHPSIIIWDSLNESTSDIVQHELVLEMKKLDPSRAWESVDFVEQHPYIYSLGPVLNKRRLGFTLPLDEIENLKTPSVVNEFLWWWLDGDGKPTKPTEEVIERWLGREWTKEDLLQHEAFLAQELVELFRRLRVDAIQPFIYLSNGDGLTANWFLGPIAELRPKPVLDALRNSFAPFGVSIELWDRHFFTGEKRRFDLYVLNDHAAFCGGTIRYGVVDSDSMWLSSLTEHVRVDGSRFEKKRCEVRLPDKAGTYHIVAELYGDDGSSRPAASRRCRGDG
ncbi:MAG: hypothetical protein COS95_07105 [Ignavibacteriales bacterium CG07_land_8_20_14_0_80_59_12]|nr:MAG: hypothetical protein COS95_07105 [Ignavibacteriales bacterium CG07_land_8_20_14_0_80_59_12]